MKFAEVSTRRAVIPWNSWYGDTVQELEFPDPYRVTLLPPKDASGLSREEMAASLADPLESQRLAELARNARNAVIAVDDITRPTPAAEVLPLLLEELSQLGVDKIKIIIALGAHRPMTREEMILKLGRESVDRLDIEQHHPYENLVDLGKSSRGTPIRVNKNFMESDLKIALGAVMPHPYAGFSGGAKIVLPGLSGISTLKSNHQPAVTGISGGLGNPDVQARRDIEEIATKVGLQFTCNCVVNSQKEIAGLFCGHPVASHRSAAEFCRQVYTTPVPNRRFDVLVLNAYPKDGELLQVGNVFNAYRTRPFPLLHPHGRVVITANCHNGRGHHSLHGKDMQLYRVPGERGYLKGRKLMLFSPNLNRKDFEVSFWKEYDFSRSWKGVLEWLSNLSGKPEVAVLPLAPLQLLAESEQ